MATIQTFAVAGYDLRADRAYDPDTHLWVELRDADRARIGFDPLGQETCGDIVELSFEAPGTEVRRGEAFGNVEAAKFVGPLLSPLGGTLEAVNVELVSNPMLVNDDPQAHWLVELRLLDAGEADALLRGEEQVAPWFAGEVEHFKRRGAIAE